MIVRMSNITDCVILSSSYRSFTEAVTAARRQASGSEGSKNKGMGH